MLLPSQNVQHVPSEQLQRESTKLHTKWLGRFEDSIRQFECAHTEKNLLKQRLMTKSEKHDKLKHELQALKGKDQETSSIYDNMASTQSRISACEFKITNLKKRIKELEKVIEKQDMQARRDRDMVTIQT